MFYNVHTFIIFFKKYSPANDNCELLCDVHLKSGSLIIGEMRAIIIFLKRVNASTQHEKSYMDTHKVVVGCHVNADICECLWRHKSYVIGIKLWREIFINCTRLWVKRFVSWLKKISLIAIKWLQLDFQIFLFLALLNKFVLFLTPKLSKFISTFSVFMRTWIQNYFVLNWLNFLLCCYIVNAFCCWVRTFEYNMLLRV